MCEIGSKDLGLPLGFSLKHCLIVFIFWFSHARLFNSNICTNNKQHIKKTKTWKWYNFKRSLISH